MNTMHEAMTSMFERAADNLTLDELTKLAALSESAADEACRLSGLCEGIACLVLSDSQGGTVGNFQNGDDVFGLLCSLAQSFDTLAGMTDVATRARSEADRRKESVK